MVAISIIAKKKIKKLHLFKKDIRLNTILLAFTVKAYPFIKDKRREDYCNIITTYCNTLMEII